MYDPILIWTYIGDGVYAAFDGHTTWLRTDREEETHYIGLEPEISSALADFEKNKARLGGFKVVYAAGYKEVDGVYYEIFAGSSLQRQHVENITPPLDRDDNRTAYILEFDRYKKSREVMRWAGPELRWVAISHTGAE